MVFLHLPLLPVLFSLAGLDCRWTVNTHEHTDLFSSLSHPLQAAFANRAITLYPQHTPGWIDYPTDLFAILPANTTTPDAGMCATVTNSTTSYES
jgi:hypothetical protein